MLKKCKTCEKKEFIPARRNIVNCSKCIILKKAKKTNQKKKPLNRNQKVNEMMMKKGKHIEHKQLQIINFHVVK